MTTLPPNLLARLVTEALQEDLGPGDVTTGAIVPAGTRARGEILTRGPIVVAGLDAAAATFRQLDPECRVLLASADGQRIEPGGHLLSVEGSARALLSGERTALNFLGRLSGIATLTRAFVQAAAGSGTVITDTRKTTPGLRALEKHAVASGGGTNHRLGLWDALLIKDNHVDLAGGVGRAVALARQAAPGTAAIEVEVRNLAELDEALSAGASMVLLDNFGEADLRAAAAKARGRCLVEVSGGVRLEQVKAIAALGVSRISVGALTHSAPTADLTMRISRMTT
jgi:nicotinate-nucleotide pyrophosphorylase (carboxylating)